MKKLIATILSVIIVSGIFISIGRITGVGNLFSETNEAMAKTENDSPEKIKIRNEIRSLIDHEWAGEYLLGNGYWSITMLLAPDSGYELEIHTDMGSSHRHYGVVSCMNGRINLANNIRMEFLPGNAEALIPIQWGPRKYLIPADDMLGFCNDINEGMEPRWPGKYYLRRGDEMKEVSGFPILSKEFRDYLLERPIEVEIVAVGAPASRARDCEDWKYPVTLNVGKNHGLLPGMKLHLVNRDNFIGPVIIKEVDYKKSEGVMTLHPRNKTPPAVGWKLSTHSNRWDRK